MATASDDVPLTPGEVLELSEQIPHSAGVECMCCSEEWEDGHTFVMEGLQELRAEWELIRDSEQSDYHIRYALQWLSKNTCTLMHLGDFELLTTCPSCRVERAKEEGKNFALSNTPTVRL